MRRVLNIVAVSFILSGVVGLASAKDSIPYATVPMTTVLQNLQSNGYMAIKKVDYVDGHYQVKAVNRYQQYVTVKISPQTGKIINNKQATVKYKISMIDVAKRVLAAGYNHIYKIEIDGNTYEIKAIDSHEKQVELHVDANSGKISKEWF